VRLVFFGPPGGGKGTQADRVKADAHAVPIATGDLLRAAVKAGTPIGKRAAELMGKGNLVPDDMVNELLRDRINQADAREGYILDGYPRTMGQLESLERLLAEMKMPPEKWLFIDVPERAIEERVLNRRTCKNPACQASYNLKFNPSPKGELCGKCGSELYQRPDDSAEKLKTRFAAYRADTALVIDKLRKQGRLTEVQAGTKSVDEVESLVRKALGLKAK
jgi:adenylate kinase